MCMLPAKLDPNLWNSILAFDLDRPRSEYGFTLRLAKENYWPRNFTEEAVVEYKKFIYLAAVCDFMVSPSPIVDCVWHQHLIYTQSYNNLCNLIGKQIQHVPSNRNKGDAAKFQQAKAETKKAYQNVFGEQPRNIWEFEDAFESLKLEKAKIKIRTFLVFGILAILILLVPFIFILKPIYIHLDNPYFLYFFTAISLFAILGLEQYNRNYLKSILNDIDENAVLYNLHPFELIYLDTRNDANLVHGVVNDLLKKKRIKIDANHFIEKATESEAATTEEFTILSELKVKEKTTYISFLKHIRNKAAFSNHVNAMDALKKYLIKSKKFGKLFYVNFIVLSFVLILGLDRMFVGMIREKPIGFILVGNIFSIIAFGLFLNRLCGMLPHTILPNYYKDVLIQKRNLRKNWQWDYFVLREAIFISDFAPLVARVETNGNNGDSSGGDSCGSSCGSSCGGCGGCGGS